MGWLRVKPETQGHPKLKKSSNIRETKSLKRSNPKPSTKSSKSTPSTSTSSSSSSLHGPLQQKATNPPLLGLGNVAQEQGCSYPRRSYCSDSVNSHGHNGRNRGEFLHNMEIHISNHSRKHENKESGIGSLSVGNNTKSLVEIPHKHAIDLGSGSGGVEQAQAAISVASLGRVGVADTREKSDRFQGFSNSAPGEFSHVETNPSAQNCNELRSPSLLQRGSEGDTELSNNVETRLGSFQRPSSENGMEHDSNINYGN
nr:hypothetical protein CFP56_73520 [Quercus suber]